MASGKGRCGTCRCAEWFVWDVDVLNLCITPTAYQFTGQRKDATGLYFYNVRYYDPSLGRFLQADTLVPSPANPQSLNRYSYVLNNALKYTDPTGHRECGEYCNPSEMMGSTTTEGGNSIQKQDTGLDGLAKACDLAGYVIDGVSGMLPLIAATTEVFATFASIAGAPEAWDPVAIVDGAPQTGGDILGYAGTALAVIGDYADGYTYIDWGDTQSGRPELVIGEATVIDYWATVGGEISPLGVIDFPIDVAVIRYDLYRLGGGTPRIEYRLTFVGGRIIRYDD